MESTAYIDPSLFFQCDLRVGTVIDAKPGEGLRKPALWLWIDFGSALGVRKSSAQLTALYTAEQLIGQQVVAVVNFSARQIGSFMSECLVLGAVKADGSVVLLRVDAEVENGVRIA